MRLPWQIPAALLAALGVAIWVAIECYSFGGRAVRELARLEESNKLEAAKIQQAHAVEVRELKAKDNLSQRRLADALKAAGIKSTPIVTVSGSTGPVPASGAVPPGPAPATPASGSSPVAGGPVCLLFAGEQGEIRVTSAAAKTQAGNIAIDAQADAYASGRHLFGGPLHLDARFLKPPASGRGPGWGIGGALSVADRFRTGLAFAPSSFDALWLRWDSSLSLQCDPTTFGNLCRDPQGKSTALVTAQLILRGSR